MSVSPNERYNRWQGLAIAQLSVAVALLSAPEVLILDEPTSGLDPLQRLEVRTILRELGERPHATDRRQAGSTPRAR